MGTPARIIALVGEERWAVTYVNYDGNLSGVGQTLLESYQDPKKISKLVEPGHMSSLSASPECPEGHSYKSPQRGYCVYYGRDRGEEDVDADYFATFQEAWQYSQDLPGSYLYVWDGDQWVYEYAGTSRPLQQALVDHKD